MPDLIFNTCLMQFDGELSKEKAKEVIRGNGQRCDVIYEIKELEQMEFEILKT